MKDTTLLWFQYRLLHRIVATNYFLHMTHCVDSNKCDFCKNSPETLQPLFYDCHNVKSIWKTLQEWISEQLKIRKLLNKQIVIFGMINSEIHQLYTVNWLIINLKYHIIIVYENTWQKY